MLGLPLGAHASTHPTLAVKPKKVLDGSRITVSAAHLTPRHYYTFMLVGPKAKKDRALIGLSQANTHGKIATVLKMPIILHCGKSKVYLFDAKKVMATAKVTITGCTLKGKPGAPPPAPPNRS
jgi:hypothetical protein